MKIKKTTFENPPAGTHAARITTVADLGVQKMSWQGQERQGPRLGITFELSHKKTKDGAPFAVFERLSLSLHEASKLYGVCQAALGQVPEEGDPQALLGRPVLVTIVHRESGTRVFANVSDVTAVPEGMDVPKTETPLLYFDLDKPDPATFAKLPALFRKLIEERVRPPENDSGDLDDDVPF